MSGLTQLLPHWNTPVRARVRPEPSHRVVRTEALPHDVKAQWGWIRVRSGSFHGRSLTVVGLFLVDLSYLILAWLG